MIHDLQIVSDLVRPPGARDPRGRDAGPDAPDRHRQRPDRVRGRLRRQPDGLARLLRAHAQAPRLRAAALLLGRHARPDRRGAPASAATAEGPESSPSRRPRRAGDPLARELSDFAGAVRERRDPLVTGEVGRDALVLARAGARRPSSAHRGRSERDPRLTERGARSASSAAAASTTSSAIEELARGAPRHAVRHARPTPTSPGPSAASRWRSCPATAGGTGSRPTEINYRANVCGFKMLGCDALLSASACGSLREELAPRHAVIPDQFIDRTRHRADTFFGDGVVAHAGLADPVCPALAAALEDGARARGPARSGAGGTYVCMEGPQFSTRAESQLYRSWGADVIGMTNLTEARLAPRGRDLLREPRARDRLRLLARGDRGRVGRGDPGDPGENAAAGPAVARRGGRPRRSASGACGCRDAMRFGDHHRPRARSPEAATGAAAADRRGGICEEATGASSSRAPWPSTT